ncbi:MAG TPA: F0F1 ATP synthase subunit A [Microthrixaceae bacterium]|nr:F0F1 ATP synthase subunit A [Microthrixaceae bacterium]
MFAQVEFPPIENIVEWPNWFGGDSILGFNKIAFISLIAFVVPVILFLVAGAKYKSRFVPTGVQTITESAVDFIDRQVILPTIGANGASFLPLLVSMFFFIFVCNLFEIIPTSHMPANARMANPLMLALTSWLVFIGVGIKRHGPKYFIDTIKPPGVPFALLFLVMPIEFISKFLLRPFSLAVRLFANMLAGHILLVTFSVLTITLWTPSLLALAWPFAFGMLIIFTGFELMVAFLQAYIFTLLTAVYIGDSIHSH